MNNTKKTDSKLTINYYKLDIKDYNQCEISKNELRQYALLCMNHCIELESIQRIVKRNHKFEIIDDYFQSDVYTTYIDYQKLLREKYKSYTSLFNAINDVIAKNQALYITVLKVQTKLINNLVNQIYN